jgi:hypothetical protein
MKEVTMEKEPSLSISAQPPDPSAQDERILLLAPTGRDAALAADVLRNDGLTVVVKSSMDDLTRALYLPLGSAGNRAGSADTPRPGQPFADSLTAAAVVRSSADRPDQQRQRSRIR